MHSIFFVVLLLVLANGQDTVRDIVINDKTAVLTNEALSIGILLYECNTVPYSTELNFLNPVSLSCSSPLITKFSSGGKSYTLRPLPSGRFALAPTFIQAGIFYYVNVWNQAFLFSVKPGNSVTFLTTDYIPWYNKVMVLNQDYRTTGSPSSVYAVLNKTIIWSRGYTSDLTYSSFDVV